MLSLLPPPRSLSRFFLSFFLFYSVRWLKKWSQQHSPSNIPSTSWRRVALCRSHWELHYSRHIIHASRTHHFRYGTPTYQNASSYRLYYQAAPSGFQIQQLMYSNPLEPFTQDITACIYQAWCSMLKGVNRLRWKSSLERLWEWRDL